MHVACISLSEWADVLESKIFSDLKVPANNLNENWFYLDSGCIQ